MVGVIWLYYHYILLQIIHSILYLWRLKEYLFCCRLGGERDLLLKHPVSIAQVHLHGCLAAWNLTSVIQLFYIHKNLYISRECLTQTWRSWTKTLRALFLKPDQFSMFLKLWYKEPPIQFPHLDALHLFIWQVICRNRPTTGYKHRAK